MLFLTTTLFVQSNNTNRLYRDMMAVVVGVISPPIIIRKNWFVSIVRFLINCMVESIVSNGVIFNFQIKLFPYGEKIIIVQQSYRKSKVDQKKFVNVNVDINLKFNSSVVGMKCPLYKQINDKRN